MGTERPWGSQMLRGALKGIGVLLEILGVFSAVLGYSQRYWVLLGTLRLSGIELLSEALGCSQRYWGALRGTSISVMEREWPSLTVEERCGILKNLSEFRSAPVPAFMLSVAPEIELRSQTWAVVIAGIQAPHTICAVALAFPGTETFDSLALGWSTLHLKCT